MNCLSFPHRTASAGELADKLWQHGIMPTKQRLLIAEVLFNGPRHLTANALYRQVNRRYRAVCRATVYNTLNLFSQLGLVREIAVDVGRTFYDSDTRPHHHFYNIDTGELIDVPEGSLPAELHPIAPEGTCPTDVNLVIKVRNTNGAAKTLAAQRNHHTARA